jgi:hypothetical protein
MDALFFYAAADLYVGPSLDPRWGNRIHPSRSSDQRELASLIHRIQGDGTLRLLVIRCLSLCADNCSWDDNAEKTRQILESTLTSLRI